MKSHMVRSNLYLKKKNFLIFFFSPRLSFPFRAGQNSMSVRLYKVPWIFELVITLFFKNICFFFLLLLFFFRFFLYPNLAFFPPPPLSCVVCVQCIIFDLFLDDDDDVICSIKSLKCLLVVVLLLKKRLWLMDIMETSRVLRTDRLLSICLRFKPNESRASDQLYFVTVTTQIPPCAVISKRCGN